MERDSLQAAVEFLGSWLEYRSRQVDIPGFSVAILSGDRIVFSQAYGLANVEFGEPMTTDHLFGMASQTKMFTATAILQLVGAGKLRLDDFVCDYIPWLKKHYDRRMQEITVRQLLSHSAGLIRDTLEADFWELKAPFPNRTELKKAVLKSDIAIEPNRALKYSNLGYGLVGEVVSVASGSPFAAYIDENIIRPLGLYGTHADYKQSLAEKTAAGYGVPFNKVRPVLTPRLTTRALASAVGIHASAQDMCRFAASQFFGNETLLSDWLKKEAQRTQAIITSGRDFGTEFGLGFRAQRVVGRRLIGHDGHLAGHVSATFFDPDNKLAISVAANAKDAPILQMTNGVFEVFEWFTRNSPAPKKLARFNTRLRSATGSVEIIAGKKQLAAIDPDSWNPFNLHENLDRIDNKTLRVITSSSTFQTGELVSYRFDKDLVRAVRYAGLTMLPESGFVGRAPEDLESFDDERITLSDIQHATLKVGHVMKVEFVRGKLPIRLLIDFGPKYGTTYSFIRALPAGVSKKLLIHKPVLGAVFPVWWFGTITYQVLTIGLDLRHTLASPSMSFLSLVPDPAYPRTLSPKAAVRFDMRTTAKRVAFDFKFQPLPEYHPEEIASKESESYIAWQKGKRRKAISILNAQRDEPPYWLHSSRKLIRIILVNGELSSYQQWLLEFEKRLAIPWGETVYLLPKNKLQGVTYPEGDFVIFGNDKVMANGYRSGHWSHSNVFDPEMGNDTTAYLKLKQELITRARHDGQKLTIN